MLNNIARKKQVCYAVANVSMSKQNARTSIAALRSMFSRIKLMVLENVRCFRNEFQAIGETTFLCLATAKLRIRQSCTKLSRVETWILCFPSEI